MNSDYLDVTQQGLEMTGALFESHSYQLKNSVDYVKKASISNSKYQTELLESIAKQGMFAARAGETIVKVAGNLSKLDYMLIPLDFIASVETGSTVGEAAVAEGKDLVVGGLAAGIVATAGFFFELPAVGAVAIGIGSVIILDTTYDLLYENFKGFRNAVHYTEDKIDAINQKRKDLKQIYKYAQRENERIMEEYDVDTSKLTNANNQETYYGRHAQNKEKPGYAPGYVPGYAPGYTNSKAIN